MDESFGNRWPGEIDPGGLNARQADFSPCPGENGVLLECPIPSAELRGLVGRELQDALEDYGYNAGVIATGWQKEVFLFPRFARPLTAQSFRTAQDVVAVLTTWTTIASIKTCSYEAARLLGVAGIASSGTDTALTWRLRWEGGIDTTGGARQGTPQRQNKNLPEIIGDWASLTQPEPFVGLVGQTSRLLLEAKRSGAAQTARGLLIGWKASFEGGGPVNSGSVPV
jgi:hypothetical protein